jgi:bifunctional non-homologous end joining protein LigD
VVNFRYGRRGAALTTGSKTTSPVSLEKAAAIFEKLVREKKSKGYVEIEAGQPYSDSSHKSQSTGLLPQLLNPIPEGTSVEHYVESRVFGFQEKKDGRRCLLARRRDGSVIAANGKGLEVAVPQSFIGDALKIGATEFVLDGEHMGNGIYCVFDLLSLNGISLRGDGFGSRFQKLAERGIAGSLQIVPQVFTTADKQALLDRVEQQGGEGVAIKLLHGLYVPGRPSSGGPALKHKFTESVSCVVLGVHAEKRSVALGLLRADSTMEAVGNVAAPGNQSVPQQGSVVEVRYMHFFTNGSLYQPLLLGRRDDIAVSECILAQITRVKNAMPALYGDMEE